MKADPKYRKNTEVWIKILIFNYDIMTPSLAGELDDNVCAKAIFGYFWLVNQTFPFTFFDECEPVTIGMETSMHKTSLPIAPELTLKSPKEKNTPLYHKRWLYSSFKTKRGRYLSMWLNLIFLSNVYIR